MGPLDEHVANAPAGQMPAGASSFNEAGRFVEWRFIGAGGTADVYRVRDCALGIDLAVKLLRHASARGRASMINEVLVSRALRHPFICPVHDIYDGARGFGVVMDVLEGYDLKAWLEENAGALHATMQQRLGLIEKLADALVIAHRRIVHRDLKPANIFLVGRSIERPLIMDFGLSLLDAPEIRESFAGTPKYMAPEQLGGLADARSDIFALGVVAYELLTGGEHPLGAARRRPTYDAWANAEIAPPSAYCALIGGAVDRLVLQMLHPNPEQRPAGAAEVVAALRAAIAARGGNDAPAGAPADDAVAAPAGRYVIGSPPTSAYPSEKPMRRISLSAFRLARRPVTNREYLAYCRATGAAPPPEIDDPVFGAADHPVVMIDWAAAADYAKWAGGRLPTEAEWEAAAKGGATLTDYPWGDDALAPERANADGAVGATTPVGAYPLGRNALGLDDMAGNVWEWCADAYDERAYRQIRDGAENPRAPEPRMKDAHAIERVLRGGAFDSLPGMCRTAFRHRAPAGARRRNVGFRVAFDAVGD